MSYASWRYAGVLHIMTNYFSIIFQHSCIDGTISITYSTFILFSLLENPDIDWDAPINKPIKLPSTELKFEIDSYLEKEILRVQTHVDVELVRILNYVYICYITNGIS